MKNVGGGSRQPINDVLLIESHSKEIDVYSDIIREVSNCKIDVMSRVGGSFNWLVPSNYQLIVIDTHALSTENTKINALALLERIKRVSPETSVILLSEKANIEEAVAAIRLGAEDYLKKPFNLETFKLAIKRGLDRKFIFGDNMGASGYLHLLNSCQMISASLEQSKIFNIVKSYFCQELSSNYSAIYSLHDGKPIRMDEAPQENKPDRAVEEILDIAIYASNPLPKMVELDENLRFIDRGQLTPGLFIFRFRCAGDTDYFCVCLSPKRPAAMDSFENRLHLLQRQIEVAGINIKQYMGVQHLVYVDDVTGLYNTRYLNFILDREIDRHKKTGEPFAVLFIDADHFKSVNDSHGHLFGTKLLNELGNRLKQHVRDSDTLFRYGGDEFVAVLSPCDLETARAVAERIRESTEKNAFLDKENLNIHFTVSIGVALFPDHASSKREIIQLADQAMYSAKKRSRNCVEVLPLSKDSKVVKMEKKEAPKGAAKKRPRKRQAAG